MVIDPQLPSNQYQYEIKISKNKTKLAVEYCLKNLNYGEWNAWKDFSDFKTTFYFKYKEDATTIALKFYE